MDVSFSQRLPSKELQPQRSSPGRIPPRTWDRPGIISHVVKIGKCYQISFLFPDDKGGSAYGDLKTSGIRNRQNGGYTQATQVHRTIEQPPSSYETASCEKASYRINSYSKTLYGTNSYRSTSTTQFSIG